MFMHDHEKPKKRPMFCTLMKEICDEGWTPSMGEVDVAGKKVRPLCHKWVGVFVNDPRQTPPVREVFDCNEQWATDMQQQTAQEVYHGAAATESVRNHVAEHGAAVRRSNQIFTAIAENMKIKLPPPPQAPALTNGKEKP